MKYVVDLVGFNDKYKFPQQGDKVCIKPPLTEEETAFTNTFQFTTPNSSVSVYPQTQTYFVHEKNHEGNDAGFGWVWLFNSKTRHYDYKMSIFDRRTIPGDTEIPHVGYSNLDAYHIIKCRETVRTGYALTNFFKRLYGLFCS